MNEDAFMKGPSARAELEQPCDLQEKGELKRACDLLLEAAKHDSISFPKGCFIPFLFAHYVRSSGRILRASGDMDRRALDVITGTVR